MIWFVLVVQASRKSCSWRRRTFNSGALRSLNLWAWNLNRLTKDRKSATSSGMLLNNLYREIVKFAIATQLPNRICILSSRSSNWMQKYSRWQLRSRSIKYKERYPANGEFAVRRNNQRTIVSLLVNTSSQLAKSHLRNQSKDRGKSRMWQEPTVPATFARSLDWGFVLDLVPP